MIRLEVEGSGLACAAAPFAFFLAMETANYMQQDRDIQKLCDSPGNSREFGLCLSCLRCQVKAEVRSTFKFSAGAERAGRKHKIEYLDVLEETHVNRSNRQTHLREYVLKTNERSQDSKFELSRFISSHLH